MKGSLTPEVWSDRREPWPEAHGCDARITCVFMVQSRDVHTALNDGIGRIPVGEWSESADTLEAAVKLYQERISRPNTVECDIEVKTEFGGVWTTYGPNYVPHPQCSASYMYLVRWRKDGAYLESYHMNSSKFGERVKDDEHVRDEKERQQRLGSMAHWTRVYEEEKKTKMNAKRSKVNE
jgi:hypothetical protein